MLTTFAAVVIGAHLYTPHFGGDGDTPESLRVRDNTPGLYIRTESGLTAGVVRNSLSRTSFYAGQTWTTDNGRWSLTIGAMTGYQYHNVYGQHACRTGYTSTADNPCMYRYGKTNAVLRPLIAPSVALPTIVGLTPRVSLLGKGVHFSLEAPL